MHLSLQIVKNKVMLKSGMRRGNMKVINNLSENHFDALDNILFHSGKLYIASPFMSESPYFYKLFFNKVRERDVKEIILITTLEDHSPDLIKKSNALFLFCLGCKQANIKYSVRIDNKLHGKLYIGINNGKYRGIITSANFTESGLKKKNEWGVMIEDNKVLVDTISKLQCNSIELDYNTLDEIIKMIDTYKAKNKLPSKTKIKLKITDIINKKQKRSEQKADTNSSKKYFLKPVGYAEKPFETSRVLNASIEKLHFAKRPVAVEVGDILICYGVGTTKLLGYFEVISDVINLSNGSRWEWEVEGKNLFPLYSTKWNQFDLTLSKVRSKYTGSILTHRGGDSLGSLNRGADKIRLNEDFAHYLISEMENQV